MRTLIVGHGGRESSLAWKMSESSVLFAFMGHKNPSIIHYVNKSGGKYKTGNIIDPEAIAAFAVAEKIDLAMVSSDELLAAGVVDALLNSGIPTVGPTKAGAEIEWNKEFSREITRLVAPDANPFYRVAHNEDDVVKIFNEIGDRPIVIKPQGLTGGKGVKVMGPHLADTAAAKAYALEILQAGIGGSSAVIIEERLIGAEFTIQAITDGKTVIMPPATYDYPYRYQDDKGPGTGGMGAYSVKDKNLPFMTLKHYEMAEKIIKTLVAKLAEMGRHFNGVLNSGFFLTENGDIKVIEFNARFGDPECMNIMLLLDSDWIQVMQKIAQKNLTEADIKFKKAVSLIFYLVSPDYSLNNAENNHIFTADTQQIEKDGCKVFFASSENLHDDTYKTIGVSRNMAIGCIAETLEQAHTKIANTIHNHVAGPLEWRKDIGTLHNINFIKAKLSSSVTTSNDVEPDKNQVSILSYSRM